MPAAIKDVIDDKLRQSLGRCEFGAGKNQLCTWMYTAKHPKQFLICCSSVQSSQNEQSSVEDSHLSVTCCQTLSPLASSAPSAATKPSMAARPLIASCALPPLNTGWVEPWGKRTGSMGRVAGVEAEVEGGVVSLAGAAPCITCEINVSLACGSTYTSG